MGHISPYSFFTPTFWTTLLFAHYFGGLIEGSEATITTGSGSALEDELLQIHVLWRHGERSPLRTFKNDPNQESAWPRGFGQLSARFTIQRGMEQQVELGKRISAEYVERRSFLSPIFHPKEVYVRSTDADRTLSSAISNFIGFYGSASAAREKIDYPRMPSDWPGRYVPVAVHTHDKMENDHWGNPDSKCPRQSALRRLWDETPEYRAILAEHQPLLDDLARLTGENVSLHDVLRIVDTLKIEQDWGLELAVWAYNATLLEQLDKLKDVVWAWRHGLGIQPYKGVDWRVELGRIRAGTMLWDILGNTIARMHCHTAEASEKKVVGRERHRERRGAKDSTHSSHPSHMAYLSGLSSSIPPPPANCEDPMLNIKYFAYSVHDSTISALLTALGLNQTNFDVGSSGLGYPDYASAMVWELWKRKKRKDRRRGGRGIAVHGDNDSDFFLRIHYWPPNSSAIDLSSLMQGCSPTSGCKVRHLLTASLNYLPEPSIQELCENITLVGSAKDDVDDDDEIESEGENSSVAD